MAEPTYTGATSPVDPERKIRCWRCRDFATHRAQQHVTTDAGLTVLDRDYCDAHLTAAIKSGVTLWNVTAFMEYRRFVRRHQKWRSQSDRGQQGVLL